MAARAELAVTGWIRENYQTALIDDIINIIYAYFWIIIDSAILTSMEQLALLDLLFVTLREQQGNENITKMDINLLFRASEHDFRAEEFHKHCDNRGGTVTIIHNEHDHVFGGYVSKSWSSHYDQLGRLVDSSAFLFMVRPSVRSFQFRENMNIGICNNRSYGPMFGQGADIWIGDKSGPNGCGPVSFDFDPKELCGNWSETQNWIHWNVKEYEVFAISISE